MSAVGLPFSRTFRWILAVWPDLTRYYGERRLEFQEARGGVPLQKKTPLGASRSSGLSMRGLTAGDRLSPRVADRSGRPTRPDLRKPPLDRDLQGVKSPLGTPAVFLLLQQLDFAYLKEPDPGSHRSEIDLQPSPLLLPPLAC